MQIAIISDFNIGGQPTALWRAINKYTDHKARCIIARDDSFQYDKDIILNTPEAKEEAADWCKKADFFYFGRSIFNWTGMDLNKLLNKHNCCIKYYGTELRTNWPHLKPFHERTGIAAITGTDWTITGHLLNSFTNCETYFTKYGDMEEEDIPKCDQSGDVLKICAGSAGSPIKGYDFFAQVVKELQAEGLPIELDFISEVSNKVCLERKLKYNATFTSINGGWGISGIESMFLGHTVLSCLDPWVYSLYPDNPTVIIDKVKVKAVLKRMCNSALAEAWQYIREKSRWFAIQNFNTRTILKKQLFLIDLIQHNEEYMKGGKSPDNLYVNF